MASALGKEGRQIAHSFSCNGFKTISVFTRYIDRCLSLSVASNTELINDHKNIRSNQKKALDATYSSGSEKKLPVSRDLNKNVLLRVCSQLLFSRVGR